MPFCDWSSLSLAAVALVRSRRSFWLRQLGGASRGGEQTFVSLVYSFLSSHNLASFKLVFALNRYSGGIRRQSIERKHAVHTSFLASTRAFLVA